MRPLYSLLSVLFPVLFRSFLFFHSTVQTQNVATFHKNYWTFQNYGTKWGEKSCERFSLRRKIFKRRFNLQTNTPSYGSIVLFQRDKENSDKTRVKQSIRPLKSAVEIFKEHFGYCCNLLKLIPFNINLSKMRRISHIGKRIIIDLLYENTENI